MGAEAHVLRRSGAHNSAISAHLRISVGYRAYLCSGTRRKSTYGLNSPNSAPLIERRNTLALHPSPFRRVGTSNRNGIQSVTCKVLCTSPCMVYFEACLSSSSNRWTTTATTTMDDRDNLSS